MTICKPAPEQWKDLEGITWPCGDTKFLFKWLCLLEQHWDTSSTPFDVILTTHPERFCITKNLQLGISDHDMVVTIRKWKLPKPKPKLVTYRSMKRFDADLFVRDLHSVPWDSVFIYTDINDTWAHWCKLFTEVIDLHIPLKKKLIRGKTVSWMTLKLFRL